VDWHPVHEHKILRGSAASHIEPAPPIPCCGDAGQRPEIGGQVGPGTRRRNRFDIGRLDATQPSFRVLHGAPPLHRHALQGLGRCLQRDRERTSGFSGQAERILVGLVADKANAEAIAARWQPGHLIEAIAVGNGGIHDGAVPCTEHHIRPLERSAVCGRADKAPKGGGCLGFLAERRGDRQQSYQEDGNDRRYHGNDIEPSHRWEAVSKERRRCRRPTIKMNISQQCELRHTM